MFAIVMEKLYSGARRWPQAGMIATGATQDLMTALESLNKA